MSDIQVISGTRRSMREMSDGTVRVQIDIDPRFRAQFFEMFGQIDMPVALAPLAADFEKREPQPEKPKGGELARMAGVLCQDVEFRVFMNAQGWHAGSDQEAAETIRQMCGVTTRADLDHDADAAYVFHRVIRGPWVKWKAARGLK